MLDKLTKIAYKPQNVRMDVWAEENHLSWGEPFELRRTNWAEENHLSWGEPFELRRTIWVEENHLSWGEPFELRRTIWAEENQLSCPFHRSDRLIFIIVVLQTLLSTTLREKRSTRCQVPGHVRWRKHLQGAKNISSPKKKRQKIVLFKNNK